MNETNDRYQNWHRDFFTGVVFDAWRGILSETQTQREVESMLRWLGARPGSHLLDLPCGEGRHSLPFAKMGYPMTGLDISTEALARATAAAKEASLPATFVRADLRDPIPGGPFDGAVCLGNSFSHFDREGTEVFIANVASVLRPGSRWIIESGAIAESLLPTLLDRLWYENNGVTMLFENHYVATESRLDTTCTFIRDGVRDTREFFEWIYTLGEVSRMMSRNGFRVLHCFSSLDDAEYRLGSQYLYLVTERTG